MNLSSHRHPSTNLTRQGSEEAVNTETSIYRQLLHSHRSLLSPTSTAFYQPGATFWEYNNSGSRSNGEPDAAGEDETLVGPRHNHPLGVHHQRGPVPSEPNSHPTSYGPQMNIASLKQEYRLQQQANSSSNEEGMNEAGELDDDDIDDEDLDDEEEDEGEDSVGDEEEEASQHSLCEYFHNNTHLAPGAKGNFPTPNGSALHHRDGYQQQKHSMDFASAGAFHHSSHTYEAAQAANVSSSGLGINRKRAFSFAASTSNDAPHHQMLANIAANANAAVSGAQHGEKRAATKICRVCGDKAYSYNFNVITCESCKAFFRRNANKEKEIRCPFNEQCDINIVSRRFCQRCRLQKCFRVGMKKEWIMSDEQRMEKKLRIQANRQRRMAERQAKDLVGTGNEPLAALADASAMQSMAQIQPPIDAMLPVALGEAAGSTAAQQQQKLIQQVLNAQESLQSAVANSQPTLDPFALMSGAAAAAAPIQQQMAVAAAAAQVLNAQLEKQAQQQQQMAELVSQSQQQQMVEQIEQIVSQSQQQQPISSTPSQQQAQPAPPGNNIGPSAMTTTTTFCSSSTSMYQVGAPTVPQSQCAQSSAQQQSAPSAVLSNGTGSLGVSPSIMDVVSSQLQQQQQQQLNTTSPLAHSFTPTQAEEAAAALAANAVAVQQQLNAQVVQQLQQQLVVEELVAKQQQAVAVAAAQQQLQQQQLAAAAVAVAAASSILQQQQHQADSVVSAFSHSSEQSTPSVATQVIPLAGLDPPQQSGQAQPQQELIAVPKDVLIKLVEQKIESDQQIEQMQQQAAQNHQTGAPPPLKCQCRCQCGRYPPEELIVDRVMTDMLNESSSASAAQTTNTVSNHHQPTMVEAMDTAPPTNE